MESIQRIQNPSAYLLGKFAAGDCSEKECTYIQRALPWDRDAANRLRDMQGDSGYFMARYPSFTELARGKAARDRKEGMLSRMFSLVNLPVVPVAAAALLAIFSLLPVDRPADMDLNAKGTAQVKLMVKRQETVIPVAQRLTCKPGDALQMVIVSDYPVFYALLSRESDGSRRTYMLSGGSVGRAGSREGEPVMNSLVVPAGWQGETLYCVYGTDKFTARQAWSAVDGKEESLKVSRFELQAGGRNTRN